jgi:hypothetical protein
VPKDDITPGSFNHLCRLSEEGERYSEPERFGRDEVDGQIKLPRFIDRQIARGAASSISRRIGELNTGGEEPR